MTNEEAIKRLLELIDSNRDIVLAYNSKHKATIQPYYVEAIQEGISALRESSYFENCNGCINDQCSICVRYAKLVDMYEVEE